MQNNEEHIIVLAKMNLFFKVVLYILFFFILLDSRDLLISWLYICILTRVLKSSVSFREGKI